MKYVALILIMLTAVNITNSLSQDNSYLNFPDSSITYSFTDPVDSVPFSKDICTRISDTTTLVTMNYVSGQWLNATKTTYFTDNGSLYTHEFIWSDSAWQPTSLTIKGYDGELLTTSCEATFSSDSSCWIIQNESRFYYNEHLAVDSVLYLSYDNVSCSLITVKKDIWSNSYDLPICITYYEYRSEKGKMEWMITGKSDFMYNEEGHAVVESVYTYKKKFELDQKIYTDRDSEGNVIYREVLSWKNDKKEWSQLSLYQVEQESPNVIAKSTFIREGKELVGNTSQKVYKNGFTEIERVEDYSWDINNDTWIIASKTYYDKLTVTTKIKTIDAMDNNLYISERSIIIGNSNYCNSDYSLYSISGKLLQKGVINANSIALNPNIENQTLVVILMNNSNIISQKLSFLQ